MLAGQLQRRKVNYRVIDRRSHLHSSGASGQLVGCWPRSLEIWDQLGLLEGARERGLPLEAIQSEKAHQTLDRGHDGYGTLALHQSELEELLEDDLRRCGGRVEWSTDLVSFRKGFHFVEAELRGQQKGEAVTCRWLVGCDGWHSTVRAGLELARLDGDAQQTFLMAEVDIQGMQSRSQVWKRESLTVIPRPKHPLRYGLSLVLPPPELEEGQDVLELLRQHAGPLLPPDCHLEKLYTSRWLWRSPQGAGYREGRVLLAGEAASGGPVDPHLVINVGLQDAINLGWKLAAVVRGEALDGLVDTYPEERMAAFSPEIAWEHSGWIPYRESSLALGSVPPGDIGAQPGEPIDCIEGLELPDGGRRARLTEWMRGGEFQLLGYGGDWSSFVRLRERLQDHFGSELGSWAVLAHQECAAQIPGSLPYLVDRLGQVRASWGQGPGAILVRPDGHVAWRGRPTVDQDLGRLLTRVSLNYA